MAYTTIDDPSAHFHTQLYTGNGSSGLSITNDANAGDFKPDWLWLKPRSLADNHVVLDSSRTSNKRLKVNSTDAEDSDATAQITFETDGFDLDTTDQNFNNSGSTYVAWQWKANGGTTASNTDGSITSTVQANTTAGFSIITFTGNGSNNTFGHGLGATPDIYFLRRRDSTGNWLGYHTLVDGSFDYIRLNLQNANANSGLTAPTSSVITFNTSGDFVGYCFKSIQGYSKIGTYAGNGSTDGAFVYTGFKPAFLIVKRYDTTGNWLMYDNKRDIDNEALSYLLPNANDAESTAASGLDLLSNGFKLRISGGSWNGSGNNYIYIAFAEHPFVSSKGAPVTAR